MPRPSLRIFLALLVLVPFLASCQSMKPQDVETLYLPDREPWVRVNAQDDGHATLVEYVPKGQTLEGWRELLTIQALDDRLGPQAPHPVMDQLQSSMRARGGELDWHVIEEDAQSVLYEWTLRSAKGIEDQGELARLIRGKDALHRAAFAFKGLPLAPERRADRLELLRKARVVKGELEYQAAVREFFPDWKPKN